MKHYSESPAYWGLISLQAGYMTPGPSDRLFMLEGGVLTFPWKMIPDAERQQQWFDVLMCSGQRLFLIGRGGKDQIPSIICISL
jgi:hypothetical protein